MDPLEKLQLECVTLQNEKRKANNSVVYWKGVAEKNELAAKGYKTLYRSWMFGGIVAFGLAVYTMIKDWL